MPLIEEPRFREKLAAVEVELKALEMTQLRVVADEKNRGARQAQPGLLDPQAQGLGDPAGDDGVADGCRRAPTSLPYQPHDDARNEPDIGPDYAAEAAPTYFNWRKISIYGGSNEIQRNIVAKAILGL